MQPSTSTQAMTQLQAQQAQSQDPNAILQQQNQQFGVGQAQQAAQGLQGAINNTTKLLSQVAPSVMGRVGGSLVTQAQASKQIQNEQAPISSNLTQEGTDYNQAEQNLADLQGKAQTAASGVYQGQQDKLSYLQNVYNNLYTQEQDAAKAAEQQREYNASLAEQQAEAKASAASGNASNYLNPSSTSQLPQGMSLKGSNGGSGYNFNVGGNAVSAAKFAQANGADLRNLLLNMANTGDKTAGAALLDLQKSGGKWTPAIQTKYSSLFWGV